MLALADFPTLDACLNAATALLLVTGWVLIRSGRRRLHQWCMLSAFGTSVTFLAAYLYYHAHVGSKHFQGQGWVRPAYFALLGTHTVLAAAIVPLALITLTLGLRGRFDRHRRIARWTLPLWLYVSVTGVVVYWLLYRVSW